MLNNTNSLNNQKLKTFLSRILICIISLFCVFSMLVENYADASGIELDESPASYIVDTIPDTMEDLADSVNLSASAYFPSIGSQQGGSCVAWAIAYYQFTYEVAKQEKLNAKNFNNVYSPKYVWNYLNDGVNKGISIEECYNFIKQNGCIKWSEFPQSWLAFDWYTNNDNEKMLNTLHTALNYKIDKNYENRFVESQTTVPLITNNNSEYIYNMKRLLSEEEKVLCISLFMEGAVIDTLPTSNLYQGNPYVVKYTETHATSHFITLVGYNDNIYYDLNGDGQRQDFEYGAFLAADSRGAGFPNRNNGYIWIMYDALNKVSNATNLNPQKRRQVALDNTYWYIDVKKCQPKLTVEVTVSQNERNEFSISLIRDGGTTETKKIEPTFVNEIGGDRGFDGETTDLQSYTFVFDYEAHELYAGDGYYYGVEIKDLNKGDNKDTIVQKIVWRDASGYEIEQSDIQESGDTIDDHKSYYMALGTVSLGKSTQRIQKGDTDNLSVNYAPSGLYCTWESSNQSCVTVNNGVVTAVGVGTASVTVTVSSESGKEWSDTCVYTVVEGYGNSLENATTVVLNDIKNGELARSGDESWFKFTPTASDRYFLYINGNTNIKINLYKDNGETLYATEDFEEPSEIVAISKNLTAGQTYHIKLYGLNDKIGAYSFRIAKGSVLTLNLNNDNPDARHVQISTKASCNYNKLQLKIGQQTFTLTKGDDDVLRTEINDVRFKVTFVNNDSLYTTWNIDMDISAVDSLVGSNKTVSAIFSNSILGIGSGTPYSNVQVTLMAYKTSFAANVNINSSNSLQLLLNRLQETGYTLSVYSQSGASVNVTSTTKAATGMKIVKKILGTNTIVEVFHVIVLGDVQGDGYIDNMDSVIILKYDAGTGTITNIQKIAGDANQDGIVDNLDSVIILQYDAGMTDIDQCLETTEVPEDIYFGDPVEF